MTALSAHDRFTAADVARFCGVDLKTIHNWVSKGKLPGARTHGRHLRFRRIEVVDFLRAYRMPVPKALSDARPGVVLAMRDEVALAGMRRALAKRFDVTTSSSLPLALVAIGAHDPDALVADAALTGLDMVASVAELMASDATRHVRVVVLADDEALRSALGRAGAHVLARGAPPPKLREMLVDVTAIAKSA